MYVCGCSLFVIAVWFACVAWVCGLLAYWLLLCCMVVLAGFLFCACELCLGLMVFGVCCWGGMFALCLL